MVIVIPCTIILKLSCGFITKTFKQSHINPALYTYVNNNKHKTYHTMWMGKNNGGRSYSIFCILFYLTNQHVYTVTYTCLVTMSSENSIYSLSVQSLGAMKMVWIRLPLMKRSGRCIYLLMYCLCSSPILCSTNNHSACLAGVSSIT